MLNMLSMPYMLNALCVFPEVPTALACTLSVVVSPHPVLEQSLGVDSLLSEHRWLFQPEPRQPPAPADP